MRRISALLNRSVWLLPSLLLASLGVLIYYPGISGPFIFDDLSNIISNSYVRLLDINQEAITTSAQSGSAGPLGRPFAVLSFALNYYFANGFDNTHFKATNVAIHIFNGILIFWFVRLVLSQIQQKAGFVTAKNSAERASLLNRISLMTAVLWLAHPVQLTSVLYVVQRMTSLSALFVLVALICYLYARIDFNAGRKYRATLLLAGSLVSGVLGIFSKENAALLPIFILLMEFTIFPDKHPWSRWKLYSRRSRRIFLVFAAATAVFAMLYIIANYILPGYSNRPFTFYERQLTESRVLFFYIFLVLVPRINSFGLHHDDIAISQSLVSPWTTLPSVLGLLLLLVAAFYIRKKLPIIAFGILWYFTAHLLESTVIPLEIAHEHRNYLASLGIVLAITYGIFYGANRFYNSRTAWLIFALLLITYAGTTFLRSTQWANEKKLFTFEAIHHPDSARASLDLGGMLIRYDKFEEARSAFAHAASLQPAEPSHLMWQQVMNIRLGKPYDPSLDDKIVNLITAERMSPTTLKSFGDLAGCLQRDCKLIAVSHERWLFAAINANKGDRSYNFYLLGINYVAQERPAEAVKAFLYSHQLDNKFLNPLLNLVSLYIQADQITDAENVLAILRTSNLNTPFPKDREIDKFAKSIEELKSRK